MSIRSLRAGWSPIAYFPQHKMIGVHVPTLTNIWVDEHPFLIPRHEVSPHHHPNTDAQLVEGLQPWFTSEARNLLLQTVDQHAMHGDAESLVMKCSPKCGNRIRNPTELQVYDTRGAGAFIRRGIAAGTIPTDSKGMPMPKKKRHRITKKKKRPAPLTVSEAGDNVEAADVDKAEPEDDGFLGDAESAPSTANKPSQASISDTTSSPPPSEHGELDSTTAKNLPVVAAWYQRPEQSCFCDMCLDPPERYARIDDSDLE